jgi:uncharacterized protein (DUF4415 family)
MDPDDAPELTREFFETAEVYAGDRFVRRGPGRPPAEKRKEPISIRLDPDVLERLRGSGPGWQSKVNELLRVALKLD